MALPALLYGMSVPFGCAGGMGGGAGRRNRLLGFGRSCDGGVTSAVSYYESASSHCI